MQKRVVALFLVVLGMFAVLAVAQEIPLEPEQGQGEPEQNEIESGETGAEVSESLEIDGAETSSDELSEGNDFSDADIETGAGITPDSAFYFVDEFFDGFGDDLENREEKVAEIKAMIEKGDLDSARKALERYKRHAENAEREISPEEEEKAKRSAEAIRRTIQEIEGDIPENERENFVNDVLEREEGIVTAGEIASKINELCGLLARQDPRLYAETCKINDDSPDWLVERHKEWTEEQEREARLFFDKLGECMRTEGRECDCGGIPHKGFSEMCFVVAPLAEACSEGDESACDEMDEETENMFEILQDAPHLQEVLKRLESFEEDRFEHHIPRLCREAGITGQERDDRRKCMAIMIEEEAPEECREALREAVERGVTDERQFREICEEIMFREYAPEECIEAGIRDHEECSKLMFRTHAPEECIEAGLTGESRSDEKKCREIMERFERTDRSGPNRGPGEGINFDCARIDEADKRLECYDNVARGFMEEFEEREKEFEERKSEIEEDREKEFEENEVSSGEQSFGEESGNAENENSVEEFSPESNSGFSENSGTGGGNGGSGITGGFIFVDNKFFNYYFR